ncbi:MAG TPA: hypothetical protein VLM80_08860 [Anaerolineales bacterium]|nr:hypothetical protein [Anaerolineales bacterium]
MSANLFKYLLVLGILVLGSACSTSEPTATPEAAVTAAQTQAPIATETASPTATVQPKVVLIGFEEGLFPSYQMVQEIVQDLAAQNGMLVEQYADLQDTDRLAAAQMLVVSAAVSGIENFVAGFSAVPVLVVGETDLQPNANLSLVNSQGERADEKGFIAGYLASVITQDWRVGVIVQSDSETDEALRLGFNNGVIFYCGLCRPIYPPYYTYPVYSELPLNSSQEAQQAAADVLIASAVKTAYVEGSIADDWLLEYLAQAGVQLIGDEPPSPAIQEQWVATIQIELASAVQAAWERMMAGERAFQVNAPLSIANPNEELLSPGRLKLVERILVELNNGFIGTGVEIAAPQE